MIKSGRIIITQDVIIVVPCSTPQRGTFKSSNWCMILHTQLWITMSQKCDWSEFYRDAKEIIAMNAPEPHGKEEDTHIFVDSNHARDKVSCRLRSGFLMHVKTALVEQFSKKQSTVETSVFDMSLSP